MSQNIDFEHKDFYDPQIYCPICGNVLEDIEGITTCKYCNFQEDID